jgi:hypothetical protein
MAATTSRALVLTEVYTHMHTCARERMDSIEKQFLNARRLEVISVITQIRAAEAQPTAATPHCRFELAFLSASGLIADANAGSAYRAFEHTLRFVYLVSNCFFLGEWGYQLLLHHAAS